MDNEMIDKVAKACYDKYNENLIPELEGLWEDLPEDYKFRLKEGIIAAIKAMREPTEKMKYHSNYNVDEFISYDDADKIYTAYIDAILND